MKTILLLFTLSIAFTLHAQQAADTITLRVGDGSKVIFAIKDKKDLETMKKYNFQKLMDEMIYKLEVRDSTQLKTPAHEFAKKDSVKESPVASVREPVSSHDNSTKNDSKRKHYGRKTYNSFIIDIGTNNYVSNGSFPSQNNSQYSVRPWGSWYVGLNSIYRTRMAGKFFLEWGYGVSWYNFKFSDGQTQLVKDNTGVQFISDPRGYTYNKSKLTATFVNVSLVPVIDFGGNKRKPSFIDGRHAGGFRLGVGPYAGYLIDSYSKQVYKVDGDEKRERHHDNFYLNNIRYGLRAQIGFNDIDFFFNYDMNQLITDGKGPQLNAFSFGVSF
ncbi:MAG: hypothetical protein OJF59_002018 [Cytophagales bacterium]|jgi:hypothetical protein|nr:hypothetical protein [Bacteroidota bacterium]MBS1980913.1 hypothetical protein [Bacteroidota bacterium]WHZ08265.1 MAG: hypothetical protein OJF59_002018 [Cytophagales bacterium]